jgi:hypothetical protein
MKAIERLAPAILTAALLGAAPRAFARTRTRNDVVVRAHPSLDARVVDRVHAAAVVKVVGRSHGWVHVRTSRHSGWLPSYEVADDRPPPAHPADAPLATPRPTAHKPPPSDDMARSTRPEVWVADSKFHDEPPPLSEIVVERAALYARPQAAGAPVATARRGDKVDLERHSLDGKWCLVHLEGGHFGWVDADALRPLPKPTAAPPLAPTFASVETPRSVVASAPPSVSATPGPVESVVEVALQPPPKRHSLAVAVGGGLAILGQRLSSNANRPLASFTLSTEGYGAAVAFAYERAFGRRLRVDADAGYSYAGAVGVRAPGSDGTTHALSMNSHLVDAGVAVGVHLSALGGTELRARVGGLALLNFVDADPQAPVVSEQLFALNAGLTLAMPALITFRERSLGLHAVGAALAPATRVQAAGLQDGRTQTTYGFVVGGGLGLVVASSPRRGQLTLLADYRQMVFISHFHGAPERCSFGPQGCATVANRGSIEQLVSVGLAYGL